MIRLGEPEAADQLAAGEPSQILFALRFRSVSVNRVHDQRTLHAHHRAVTGIDAFDLARDQSVADVIQCGAAVALGQRWSEQAELSHFTKARPVGALVTKRS